MVKKERDGKAYAAITLAGSKGEALERLREKMAGPVYKDFGYDDILAEEWTCKEPREIDESDVQNIDPGDVLEFTNPGSW